jgi:hypothetical protein
MHDHPPLLYGLVYGVVQPFTDRDGAEHDAGEVWQFLGAHKAADGAVHLDTVGPDGVRKKFPLDASQAARIGPSLQRVDRLPWQFRPTCACETPQLQQVLGDPDCVTVVCPQCQLVFAAQPIDQQQLQILPLDEAQRGEVWQALTLDPQASLAEIVAALLGLEVLPAVRIMGHKLGQRADFGAELGQALLSTQPAERLPALAVAARLPVPHPAIVQGVVHALHHPIDPSALADEAVLRLQAVFAHAEALLGFRDAVQGLRDQVAGLTGARAALVNHLAGNVTEKMDATLVRAEAAFRQASGQLVQAVRDGGLEALDGKLRELAPDGDYAELRRGALLEGAGDALAGDDRPVANQLYGMAVQQFQAHASHSTAGGEGMERMLDVERVQGKLAPTA